jgi:hypothetical protein
MTRIFREKKTSGRLKPFLFIVLVLALFLFIWWMAGALQLNHDQEEMKIVREAIIRATVECYSLESRYPPSLDYLEENYGLALNHDKYVIHYRVIGKNIMPDIRLFKLEK